MNVRDTTAPRPARRVARVGALLLVGLVVVLGAGYWFGRPIWGPHVTKDARIYLVEVFDDGTEIGLSVDVCSGDPELVELQETDDEVRARVTTTRVRDWDDCAIILPAHLDQPFGDRTFIDLGTGQQVDRVTRVPADR